MMAEISDALRACRTFVIACRAEAKGRNLNRYEHTSELLLEIDAALLPRPVEAGVPTHKHLKSGHLVRFIGLGRMQSANWRTCPFGQGITSSFDAPVDMREVVIYEHGGDLWVRPVEEFNDGRFEALPTSPATGG